MSAPYTIQNIRESKDFAPDYGMGELGQAMFPREELGATEAAFAYHVLNPGKRHGFGHKHVDAEEIALVVRGSGRLKLDDEIVDVHEMDAIRIAPEVMRAFEAGPDGMEIIVFGARHEGDGEMDPGFWPAD